MSTIDSILTSPRFRFNSGFWDGVSNAEAGRQPMWKRGTHFDPTYEAGYALGEAEYRAKGKRPESSDLAWMAWSEED